jgi:hypothetical protein
MRWTAVAVALCVCAAAVPGCTNKGAVQRGTMASNERPMTAEGVPLAPGMIYRVSVALHSGEQAKDPADVVTVRLLRGSGVIAERALGAGEAWAPGSMRAAEIPLTEPLPQGAARDLRLEVSKAAPDGPGRAWSVQVEALGLLSDGRVVRLLEPTPGMLIGGENPFLRAWTLAPQ